MSEEKLKQRAIIQFCLGSGHTPAQNGKINKSTVAICCAFFVVQMA